MGYAAYTSCPASEVPENLVWGEPERRFPAWGPRLLITEYGWPPGHPCAIYRVFIPGAPWERTVNTTLPEDDPGRVTYFRLTSSG